MELSGFRDRIRQLVGLIYPDVHIVDSLLNSTINNCLKKVAKKICITGLQKQEVLSFEGEEDSDTGWEAKTPLPHDFDHDLYLARNETQDTQLTIYASVGTMRSDYAGQTLTGSVEALAYNGSYLWALLCPSTEESVSVNYYKIPDNLEEDDDEPEWLPEVYHEDVIVNGVMAELLITGVRQDIEAGGVFAKIYQGRYGVGYEDLRNAYATSPKQNSYYPRPKVWF